MLSFKNPFTLSVSLFKNKAKMKNMAVNHRRPDTAKAVASERRLRPEVAERIMQPQNSFNAHKTVLSILEPEPPAW